MKFIQPIDTSTFSGDDAERLWRNIMREEYAFDDQTRGRPDLFLTSLLMPHSQHFLIGDDGYAAAVGIQPHINAMLHFAMWRPIQPAAIRAAGRELLSYLFETYQLHRLTGLIPEFNRSANRLATLLHFKFEGQMRSMFLNHGKYSNLTIYGLLKTEFNRREECLQPQQSQSSRQELEPAVR